jgi:transcriptional regulator with XRE-family HTH domain
LEYLNGDHVLSDLGSEIRQLRKVRGITLQQLALATGKSVGFLSQIERNLTKPSVAALQDISEALSVHIGWFFPEDLAGSPEEREYIVRRHNRRRLTYSELSGTEYLGLHDSLLSANLNGELALGISRYEAHRPVTTVTTMMAKKRGWYCPARSNLPLMERSFCSTPGTAFLSKAIYSIAMLTLLRPKMPSWSGQIHRLPCANSSRKSR